MEKIITTKDIHKSSGITNLNSESLRDAFLILNVDLPNESI